MTELIERIAAGIECAADALGIRPTQVTKAQFFKHGDAGVSEWQLRKVGGIQGVKKLHFPDTHKDLASIRQGKEVRKYINKLERQLSEKHLFEDRVISEIGQALKGISVKKEAIPKPRASKTKRKMTMEAMVSDVHYGLCTSIVNLSVLRARVRHFVSVFLREFSDNQKLFNVERIIVALLGDIIQSYTMHGLESARSCEFGNFMQVESATRSLYYDLLLPIAKTGVKVDVPAVTGNHDRTEAKRSYNYPGKENATWAIYKGLEMLAKEAGLKNVTFHIPDEAWQTLDIYGNTALYEHLDNASGNNKAAFEALIQKRQKQEGKVIHFLRGGHYHEYQCYDRGRIIVNESVPGPEGYATTLGFASSAGQTINYYIETKERPTCFYKSFPVYLGHIEGE